MNRKPNRQRKNSQEVKELSKDVFLTSTDYYASDGESVARVDFELEVKRDRQIVFDIDFSGSSNLELDGNNSERRKMAKRTVLEPFSKQVIASVRVPDLDKKWTLQCSYTWTEKETKTKEISPHLLLTIVDNYLKGKVISSIEYSLKVNKGKRVIFDIDFNGSTNIILKTGGLRQRTTIEPFQELSVASLQVKNSKQPWYIESKYKWAEEEPDRALPGQPEQKEISPGILLIKNRSSDDVFTYELVCAKYRVIHFTLDISKSENMVLSTGKMIQQTVVKPWDRAIVGVVKAKNPSHSWSIHLKLDWSESDPQVAEGGVVDESPHFNCSLVGGQGKGKGGNDHCADLITQPLQQVEGLRRDTKPKTEEIAESIYLIRSTTPDPTQIIYQLSVRRNVIVTFHMDFSGSKNLVLRTGGMTTTTTVEPNKPEIVAILVLKDPTVNHYQLGCNIRWEIMERANKQIDGNHQATYSITEQYHYANHEHGSSLPPAPPPLAISRNQHYDAQTNTSLFKRSSNTVLPPQSPPYRREVSPKRYLIYNNVAELLDALGYPEYIVTFQKEELSLEILIEIARNEHLLNETLKEIIPILGHRQRIAIELLSYVQQ